MATAAPNYLVDSLVTAVRNRYIQPVSQNLFQDTDIVAFLDEEMRSYIVPLINSVREDNWTLNVDQAVTGAASYTIPVRAAGGILRDVVFVDPNGNEIGQSRLSPAQIKATFPFGYQLPLYTFGFYLQYDQYVPYPQQAVNATGYTLRMKILRRPNNLTLATNCAQILTVASNVVTVDNLPSDWTTSTLFDIIQNYPLFVSISDDTPITTINTATNQITLTSAPTGLAAGMYLCPQYMSCIPQMIYEAYPMLVQRGVVALARSLGDSQGTELAEKEYEKMKVAFLSFIEPRVQLSGKKIVQQNNPYSWGQIGSPFFR